jgi:hypothetical protein
VHQGCITPKGGDQRENILGKGEGRVGEVGNEVSVWNRMNNNIIILWGFFLLPYYYY